MFLGLTTAGTMFFFSAVTLTGLAWVWFCLPELAGKSLEAVDAVFQLKWYQIGRKGSSMTQGVGEPDDLDLRKEEVTMVEKA